MKPDDVILAIDGEDVGCDRTCRLRGDERINMAYLWKRRKVGDDISLTVVREAKRLKVKITLKAYLAKIPGENAFNCHNSYAVFGGAAFVPM